MDGGEFALSRRREQVRTASRAFRQRRKQELDALHAEVASLREVVRELRLRGDNKFSIVDHVDKALSLPSATVPPHLLEVQGWAKRVRQLNHVRSPILDPCS